MWNRAHPHDVRETLFGGKRCVRVWDLAPSPRLPFAAVLACELEPGGSVGSHVQEYFAEVVVGVEGSGSVTVNGVSSLLRPGGVVELPLGHTLAISNEASGEPLRYLIVKARP
jgi:quercetin dioxygenase-like cupin family protein